MFLVWEAEVVDPHLCERCAAKGGAAPSAALLLRPPRVYASTMKIEV